MKKKWLCFALFLCLLLWPFLPAARLEARDRLARALSATAPRGSLSQLVQLGREAVSPGSGLAALRRALDQPPFRRGLSAKPWARQAAQALMDWVVAGDDPLADAGQAAAAGEGGDALPSAPPEGELETGEGLSPEEGASGGRRQPGSG